MKKVSIALMALGLLLVAGCTPEPASLTVDDLYGVWTRTGHFFQFNEDGTYTFANTVDELTSGPLEFGEFRFEGTRLTYITDEGSGMCAGKTAIHEVERAEDGSGRIKLILVEDTCATGGAKTPSVFFTRYEP